MNQFPDESTLPRSADGSEPIRGGSVGINLILGRFVERSRLDHRPEFDAIIISAATMVRNIMAKNHAISIVELEQAFIDEMNILVDYYDTYLSFVLAGSGENGFRPVIIYFPDYSHIPSICRREEVGRAAEMTALYKKMVSRWTKPDGIMRATKYVTCYWMRAGSPTMYPYTTVRKVFAKLITSRQCSRSLSGTIRPSVALITHAPIDYYLSRYIRGLRLLESFTAKVKDPSEFKFKLDKEGRLPFLPVVHGLFGDGVLIKSQLKPGKRKELLETFQKERWAAQSESYIFEKLVKVTGLKRTELLKFVLD